MTCLPQVRMQGSITLLLFHRITTALKDSMVIHYHRDVTIAMIVVKKITLVHYRTELEGEIRCKTLPA